MQAYHYTNNQEYRSIQTKGIDGYSALEFDDFTGLIPRGRFVHLCKGENLPDVAHAGVIEALLEPEPRSWLANPEYV